MAHCDRGALLRDRRLRNDWLGEIDEAGFQVAALNVWGNPLHPDSVLARRHDEELREAIRLAALIGVDRILALAGCPGEPTFAAGGWLPYLEGAHEQQWQEQGARTGSV
jgi:sugar phosphate isomerase/epimerase